MGLLRQSKFWRTAGRTTGVAFLIAIILLLDASASCATLHQKICPDAGKPNDQCAVVAFASGVTTAGLLVEALVFVVLVLIAVRLCWQEETFPAAPLFRLSPARPPPNHPIPG